MIKSFKDTNSKKVTNPTKNQEEAKEEISLRPKSFDDFIGQRDVLDNLKVYIQAAQKREEISLFSYYLLRRRSKRIILSSSILLIPFPDDVR